MYFLSQHNYNTKFVFLDTQLVFDKANKSKKGIVLDNFITWFSQTNNIKAIWHMFVIAI